MSQDDKLNYGLDTATVDIADSVIIDVAIKPLSTIPGIHSLSPRLYDEIVDGKDSVFRFPDKILSSKHEFIAYFMSQLGLTDLLHDFEKSSFEFLPQSTQGLALLNILFCKSLK